MFWGFNKCLNFWEHEVLTLYSVHPKNIDDDLWIKVNFFRKNLKKVKKGNI